MKKHIGLLQILKFGLAYWSGRRNGVYTTCSMCGSPKIEILQAHTEKQLSATYKGKLLCNACGALCDVKEHWQSRNA